MKCDDDVLVNPFELESLIFEEISFQEKQPTPKPAIYGGVLDGGPVQRGNDKYGDFVWPPDKYPKYVSGGGFLANRDAADILQDSPKIFLIGLLFVSQ